MRAVVVLLSMLVAPAGAAQECKTCWSQKCPGLASYFPPCPRPPPPRTPVNSLKAAFSSPAPRTRGTAADALAMRAIEEGKKDNLEGAIELFRQAYETDHAPRWLYDLGVLHDHRADCDDAAFFYRAALWGRGVLPQDQDHVDNRLNVLEDECRFRERQDTAADRHARAARYLGWGMCFAAQQILSGIATPAEAARLKKCSPPPP